MTRWCDPLPAESYGGHVLTENNWFPSNGVVKMSGEGSMTSDIIPSFIRHLDMHARQFLSATTSDLLSLDGHKSEIGCEWLEICRQNNCEVVQTPANTSHFLQPCDQFVNKAFKEAVRDMRDEVSSMAIANTKSVQFNLMCGVFGFHRISTQDNTKSFQVTGLFPVNWNFSKRFKNINDRINSKFSSDQFRSSAPQAHFQQQGVSTCVTLLTPF